MGNRMPVLFIGHGSPENAMEDSVFTRNWAALAKAIPRPKAILSISAHWLEEGKTSALAVEKPRTIYDFYGFRKELYQMKYAARGAPELAEDIRGLVKTVKVRKDISWGLDHGTWIVLARMYPEADIPVLQLSIDYDLDFGKHLEIGKELAPLRENGVLIMGSGNLVHNLGEVDFDAGKPHSRAAARRHDVLGRDRADSRSRAFEECCEDTSGGSVKVRMKNEEGGLRMEFLKPNKMNVVGTAALLVANWTGGVASRSVVRLLAAGNETTGAIANVGGRAAFAGGAGTGNFGAQAGNFGLVSGVANIVILALLFYVVLSLVAGHGKPSLVSTPGTASAVG